MGSNSLAFKEWAISEGITSTSELEQLKDARLGIDAEDYLLTVLSSNASREPLLPALGGLPFALQSRVESDIQNFRGAGIEPFFVFNGLDLACQDRATALRESRKAMKVIDKAWKDYDDSQGELAVSNFGKACTYRIYHIVRSLHAILHRLNVMVQTAPYSAAAQLVDQEQTNWVTAIHGSASCLAFGAEKVILSIDWESRRFNWIDMKFCLIKTGLSRDQLIEICLLSGSSILSTFPDIDGDGPISKMQAARSALSRAGNDVSNVVAKDESYQTIYQKARFALKHPVTIRSNGKVEPINWETGPSDVHEFIGQRLPAEVYHYLSRGIIGPRLLNWRTRMEILETPPLDGGKSQTYEDLVTTKLTPLRAQSLALITHSLHRYYQNTDVSLVTWFSENEKQPLNLREITRPTVHADSWCVKLATLPAARQPSPDTSLLSYALSVLPDSAVREETKISSLPDGQLATVIEIRANIVWRFLADRGYINVDHTLSPLGIVLKTTLDKAKAHNIASEETDELLVMAIELIRLELLNSNQLFSHPPYTGAPIRGTEADKANTILVSRLATLGTFKHANIGYTGPLSRHLLAYGQVAATVRGALRDLVEAHSCNLFLSGAADRNLRVAEYTDIGASLPFVNEPDLGLGLVVKSYLDELSNESSKRQDITKWFNHALDIPDDLAKTWKLWDALVAGVLVAEDTVISAETKEMFASADEWLQNKLKATDDIHSEA